MSQAQFKNETGPRFTALYSERFVRLFSELAMRLSADDYSIAIEAATELQRRVLPESLMCVAAAAVGIAASMDCSTTELESEEKQLARDAAALLEDSEGAPLVISRQLADCVAAICTVRLRSFVEHSIQIGGSPIVSGGSDFVEPFSALRDRLKTSLLFPQFDHQLRQTLDILGIEPTWLAAERTAYRFAANGEKGIEALMGVEKLMNAAGLFVCHPTESSDLYVSAFRKNEAWLSRLVTALAARLSNVEVTRVGFNALPEGAQWTRRTLTINEKGAIYRCQAMLRCCDVDPVPFLLRLAGVTL